MCMLWDAHQSFSRPHLQRRSMLGGMAWLGRGQAARKNTDVLTVEGRYDAALQFPRCNARLRDCKFHFSVKTMVAAFS